MPGRPSFHDIINWFVFVVSFSPFLSLFSQTTHEIPFIVTEKLLNLLFLILWRCPVKDKLPAALEKSAEPLFLPFWTHKNLFSPSLSLSTDSKVGKLSIFHSAVVILPLWWFHLLFIYISLSVFERKEINKS